MPSHQSDKFDKKKAIRPKLIKSHGRKTPLHEACAQKSFKKLSTLLQQAEKEGFSIDFNAVDDFGNTPLHVVCAAGNAMMVRILLINENLKINEKNKAGLTPLHIAAALGHKDIVTSLLNHKDIDPHVTDNYSLTPLHLASYGFYSLYYRPNHEERNCRAIHLYGDGTYIITNYLGEEVEGKLNLKELGCTQHASEAVHDNTSRKKIYTAIVREGHISEHNSENNSECIIALLDKYTQEQLKGCVNANDRTPLHFAASHTNDSINAEIFIRRKLFISAVDDRGCTPLHEACKSGNVEIVKLLLEAEADPNIPLKKGTTPLITAIRTGNTALVELLLNSKVDINAQTPMGTALHVACTIRDAAMVKLLLSKNPNIGIKDQNGKTALFYACMEIDDKGTPSIPSQAVAKTFIDHSIDPNVPVSGHGKTLWDYAAENNWIDIFVNDLLKNNTPSTAVIPDSLLKKPELLEDVFKKALPLGFKFSSVRNDLALATMLLQTKFEDDECDGENILFIQWMGNLVKRQDLDISTNIGKFPSILSSIVVGRHGAILAAHFLEKNTPQTAHLYNFLFEEKCNAFTATFLNYLIEIRKFKISSIRNLNDCIKHFEKLKLPVNIQDIEGNTFLHAVCLHDNINAIHKLTAMGAQIDIKNKMGKTPYDLASEKGKKALDAIAAKKSVPSPSGKKESTVETITEKFLKNFFRKVADYINISIDVGEKDSPFTITLEKKQDAEKIKGFVFAMQMISLEWEWLFGTTLLMTEKEIIILNKSTPMPLPKESPLSYRTLFMVTNRYKPFSVDFLYQEGKIMAKFTLPHHNDYTKAGRELCFKILKNDLETHFMKQERAPINIDAGNLYISAHILKNEKSPCPKISSALLQIILEEFFKLIPKNLISENKSQILLTFSKANIQAFAVSERKNDSLCLDGISTGYLFYSILRNHFNFSEKDLSESSDNNSYTISIEKNSLTMDNLLSCQESLTNFKNNIITTLKTLKERYILKNIIFKDSNLSLELNLEEDEIRRKYKNINLQDYLDCVQEELNTAHEQEDFATLSNNTLLLKGIPDKNCFSGNFEHKIKQALKNKEASEKAKNKKPLEKQPKEKKATPPKKTPAHSSQKGKAPDLSKEIKKTENPKTEANPVSKKTISENAESSNSTGKLKTYNTSQGENSQNNENAPATESSQLILKTLRDQSTGHKEEKSSLNEVFQEKLLRNIKHLNNEASRNGYKTFRTYTLKILFHLYLYLYHDFNDGIDHNKHFQYVQESMKSLTNRFHFNQDENSLIAAAIREPIQSKELVALRSLIVFILENTLENTERSFLNKIKIIMNKFKENKTLKICDIHEMVADCISLQKEAREENKKTVSTITHESLGALAIYHAVDKEYGQLLDILLKEFRFNINARNQNGLTPLHQAIADKSYKNITSLLSWGASIHARSAQDITAKEFANQNYVPEIVALLENHASKRTRGRSKHASNKSKSAGQNASQAANDNHPRTQPPSPLARG